MKKWNRLTAGLLCAILAVALAVPVSAHGCHGRRGGGCHGRYVRNVQTEITVCPYDDCATYCGYAHGDGLCDGLCRALCPLEDCVSSGRHYHGYSIYCGAHHDGGFCDGSCALVP